MRTTCNQTITSLAGKVYPDRTFSIGIVPQPKKREAEKQYDKDFGSQYDSYLEMEKDYRGLSVEEVRFFSGGEIPDRFIKGSQLSQEVKKYGSNGITGYGRKNISNISLLLQREYGRKRLGFATATLPRLTKSGSKLLIECWGDIVRRFFQRIKRHVEKSGVEFLYVSCTEIQERRFAKSGVALPHLHWVYVARGRKVGDWYISANKLREFWQSSVLSRLGRSDFEDDKAWENWNASIDCQLIKKSASAYLGKYLSKGCKVVADMKEQGYDTFPRQWWSASMQCKKMFKESIVHLNSSLCSDIFYNLGEYLADDFVTWFRFVEIEFVEEFRTIGLVGKISKEAYAIIKNQ